MVVWVHVSVQEMWLTNTDLKPRFLSKHRSSTIHNHSQVFPMPDHALQIEPLSPQTKWLYKLLKLCLKYTRIKYRPNMLLPVTVNGKPFLAWKTNNIRSMFAFRSFIGTDGGVIVEGFDLRMLWNNGGASYIWFVLTGLLTPGNRLIFWVSSYFETWSVSSKSCDITSLYFSTLLAHNLHITFSSSSV